LSFAVSRKRFQAVARKQRQVSEGGGPVKMDELSERGTAYGVKLFRKLLLEDLFRFGASKRANHKCIVYRKAITLKREDRHFAKVHLTCKFQRRSFRLTGVAGEVVEQLLS
jgi:hypothetical protein